MTMQVVEAKLRETRGKNEARRLRRVGLVPGVLYGSKQEPVTVAISPKRVMKILESESGRNTIFTLEFDGKKTNAIIKDWQVDPVEGELLHVDLLRIAMHEKLRFKVPVAARGEPRGVKEQGGIFEYVQREIEIECLPGEVPDKLAIDVAELMIGDNFRAGDVMLEAKLRLMTDPDRVLAHVVALKAEEERPAAEVEAVAPAEPEVIKKGKVVEEGEEAEAEEAEEKE